ncbi:MAG: hypothetical protein B6241_08900 [Spirochaetaceae bacterium 4572_59]|nr:MAG: hypothetical protein B6241_08900 [Spirochaetaceae bacterium 4572_59]
MSGLLTGPLFSQTGNSSKIGDQLQKFHLLGLSFGRETRILTENYQTDSSDYDSSLGIIGLNYCTLIGSRLGFYSDLYLQIPRESQEGFLMDFTGGIGWNVWHNNWGLLPGIGFHGGCSSLKSDPFAEDEDMLYLSFGFGAGIKLLYRLTDRIILYSGFSGNYDTLEFTTNARYRDRNNEFQRAFDYKGSAGMGIDL